MTQKKKAISIHAPATVANVGCAFDTIGFAVCGIGDTVTATLADTNGVSIRSLSGNATELSSDPLHNTASVAVLSMLNDLSETPPGIALDIHKGLPIGSGLGSSSASAVAGVVAVNELLGSPLTRRELIPYAMEGERIACGVAHADNVAPALLGGFVLIRSTTPLEILQLPTPDSMYITLVSPHIELRTVDARKVLKGSTPLSSVTKQLGNVAGLVSGLFLNYIKLIGRSLEDVIIEPERSKLIPGFYSVRKAALDAGAVGCAISGSGPSLFAISTSKPIASSVGDAMVEMFATHGIRSGTTITSVNTMGASEVELEHNSSTQECTVG